MMISTRGVKFKFSAGEKVLCYEPDPTKAKVLYESKVLDLVANRDGRGRKVCEYLIHFYGWNSSWDRYVREEFILPYTEENRKLQAKLAEEAALSLKGKKKHKLPPLIKETLSKKMCSKNDTHESKQPKSPSHSSSDTESSEDEVEREVTIEIPNVLKTILENDCVLITQKNKLIKCPCEQNVISILEKYVKDYAKDLLYTTPPRNVKNGQKLMPEDVKNKLNLCKEAMDGLRIFFNETLPHLLLYRQENKQYHTIGVNCAPIYNPKSSKNEPLYGNDSELVDNLLRGSEFILKFEEEEGMDELEYKKSETEAAMRNFFQQYRLNVPNHCNQYGQVDTDTGVQSEANIKPFEIKNKTQPAKDKISKRSKTPTKSTSTRILRSSDKQKQQSSNDELSLSVNLETAENHCVTPTHKMSDDTSELPSPLRVTRKSGQNVLNSPIHQQASPSSVSCDRSVPNSPTSSIPHIEHYLPQSVSSNYCSSSNASTHSSKSDDLSFKFKQYILMQNSYMCEEMSDWHMVPRHLYEQTPANPSLIYGAHHLLRLFVKLPALISKMNIKHKKLEVLLRILENFLLYLAEKNEDLFSTSVYIDDNIIFPCSPTVKTEVH